MCKIVDVIRFTQFSDANGRTRRATQFRRRGFTVGPSRIAKEKNKEYIVSKYCRQRTLRSEIKGNIARRLRTAVEQRGRGLTLTRKWGDRRDATLLRDIDSMHYIMPLMYPNRCDNEAFISETIDLTNAMAFLEKKNAAQPEYRYNIFQIIVTAVLKTITLRPQLNRFIANYNLYQRNEVSAAFTIKRIFTDAGDEALAFIHSKPTDTLESVHDEIFRQVSYVRHEGKDQSTESMDALQKIPRVFKKLLGAGARFLDRRGWMPQSVIATDPYQSSVVLANLGSIKLHSGYHHLTNWGTTSVFCIIGEMRKRRLPDDEGNETPRMSIDIGLTIDERISDGFYCARSVRLLRKLLENPELLEQPLEQPVEY